MERMEVHKRSSKGGSFLNLFDWNGKSRKKLFSENSDRPEIANQGNVESEILPGSRLLQTNAAVGNASSSNSGRIDWNCKSSSSQINCNGHGNHAPGVVARLMGLDSMPTPNAPKSCSTSSPNFNFPRGSQNYNKPEAFSREPRIERFQNEILPPRSAKPISVTHHKLLSPIKNPAFVPTKNAAHSMEAAAKIIETIPKKDVRSKAGPTIQPPLPLRMQDLKMKLEVQQPKKARNFKIMNGKSNDRSPQGMGDAKIIRRDMESGRGNTSQSWSRKTRSPIPKEQDKANLQRREGKGQTFSKILPSEREFESSQRRTSINRKNTEVLKQNNQKQNSSLDRFGSGSKISSGQRISPNKTRAVDKVPVRTESMSSKTVRTNNLRNPPSNSYFSTNAPSKKKGTADREVSSIRSIATKVFISNEERNIKSKIGADVISFTFTSPIKSSLGAHSPVQAVTSINNLGSGKSLTFSSPAESVIGESSLSILLEEKLRELKNRVECYITDCSITSTSSLKEEDSLSTCTSSVQDSESTLDHLRSAKIGPDVEEINSVGDFDSSSTVCGIQKCQAPVIEAMEEYSRSATSSRSGKDVNYRLPSVSNHKPSLAARGSPSSTVTCSGKEESLDLLSALEFIEAEDSRTDPSDTISSSSIADIRENHVAPALLNGRNFNWEIEYIRDIIGEAELMLEDCSSTHPSELISPSLFDELESRGSRARSNDGEETDKLRRKILFDFVSECLVLRCQDLLIGSPVGWARFTALFRRKRLLAEEIYREVSGGNFIGDMVVDVLVDGDMSSKHGKWVNFRVEMFEEGVDIGQGILSSLVDELVAEFEVLSW